MAAFTRDHFDDPALVYERREARTCMGCIFEHKVLFKGEPGSTVVKVCSKGNRYGQRCKRYQERQ